MEYIPGIPLWLPCPVFTSVRAIEHLKPKTYVAQQQKQPRNTDAQPDCTSCDHVSIVRAVVIIVSTYDESQYGGREHEHEDGEVKKHCKAHCLWFARSNLPPLKRRKKF
jgi:hypothetical protein